MNEKDLIKLREIRDSITKAKELLSNLLIESAIKMNDTEHDTLSSVWDLLDDSESSIIGIKK